MKTEEEGSQVKYGGSDGSRGRFCPNLVHTMRRGSTRLVARGSKEQHNCYEQRGFYWHGQRVPGAALLKGRTCYVRDTPLGLGTKQGRKREREDERLGYCIVVGEE